MKQNHEQHILNINQFYDNDVSISQPDFLGTIHNVYIAQNQQSKNIFRLSSKKCAIRNAEISKMLTRHGFNVPLIKVIQLNSDYYEVYPFIEGKTLAERANYGISAESIKRVYKQLIDISYALAAIPQNEIPKDYNEHVKWQEKVANSYYNFINNTKKQICHNDLHDKNILLDNNDNVCAILDLDGINNGSLVLAILKMIDFAKKYGYTVEDLKYLCPQIYNGKIIDVKRQINLYTNLRTIYRITTGRYIKNKHTLQKQ